jgi:NAD(P)-dependent dehydrogenase (short-subunit alcohol dehydrogenase family)
MEMGLRGKVAVVTGGSAGIGKACALALAAEGCQVAICGRTAGKLDAAKQEFSASGYTVFTTIADASREEDVERLTREVFNQFGRIDIWLNNAAITIRSPLLAMSGEQWDDLMRSNVKSVFLGAKAAARYMKANGGGVILNASSFGAVIPSAGSGAYAASKAAVSSLTRSLAAELAPLHIRVNAYIPGVVVTEMNTGRIAKAGAELASQVALNRLGQPEEVAAAVVFLASDASRYITGTAIEVTGGKFAVQNPSIPWQWPEILSSAK